MASTQFLNTLKTWVSLMLFIAVYFLKAWARFLEDFELQTDASSDDKLCQVKMQFCTMYLTTMTQI
jgi:hypothetical protein